MSEMSLPIASPAPRTARRLRLLALLWLVSLVSIAVMAFTGPPDDITGFDAVCYVNAMQALAHGVDPFVDGLSRQQHFYQQPTHPAGARVPMIYVYTPLTVPVLRLLNHLPGLLLRGFFWAAIAVCFLLQLWAGYQMATASERRWLAYLLPFVAFFPGLLSDWTILSGNVAGILYGWILAAAVPGWKRNRWFWFYVAVVAASTCKPHMLSLLAFPLLVGRRQWLPALVTGAAGSLLFAVQSRLWPEQFHEFFLVEHAQLGLSHGFGFGPVGLLGKALWQINPAYLPTTLIAYVVWAVALGALLLVLAARVRRRPELRSLWIPVAMVGTILLNVRTTCCDTAAITVPMLLIGWRALVYAQQRLARDRAGKDIAGPPRLLWPALVGAALFLAFNLIDVFGVSWLPVEGTVLLGIFALGLSELGWFGREPVGQL